MVLNRSPPRTTIPVRWIAHVHEASDLDVFWDSENLLDFRLSSRRCRPVNRKTGTQTEGEQPASDSGQPDRCSHNGLLPPGQCGLDQDNNRLRPELSHCSSTSLLPHHTFLSSAGSSQFLHQYVPTISSTSALSTELSHACPEQRQTPVAERYYPKPPYSPLEES